MSNSELTSHVRISPHKNEGRNHKVDTITIHCYVGQASVESMGAWFSNPNAHCSANYGIGVDGRIGLFVDECDRSWCTSSSANDNRAITIECASDRQHPYAINDKVYKSLINLCADICRRNGIKELKWVNDKSLIGQVDKQNMTVHMWFANKACPGEYIFSRLGQIAAEVNAKLGVKETVIEKPEVDTTKYYRVQTGAFRTKELAEALEDRLEAAGFDTYIVMADGFYKVQVGAFKVKENAEKQAKELQKRGFATYITTEVGKPVSSQKSVIEVAREVIAGKWGNGDDRKKRLIEAGYNYKDVQDMVNEIL